MPREHTAQCLAPGERVRNAAAARTASAVTAGLCVGGGVRRLRLRVLQFDDNLVEQRIYKMQFLP